ncbi:Crp/Fnr family transcriptional regulator [Pusillimonas minor]|uniref:Crp/Fnr family transcriptional regulator n=1 Tax=Pusillimonas minor TaxID=2697024 RepID=A0A842HMG8_9BURK|nr:Crp/Fnr family transcriptional regulator [Pusillimonas minor]MBC2769446.1 Crp/Fnr family transcriptional regulator [Pusillimonas minor]
MQPRQVLFRAGQPFANVYLVRTGYLKTVRHTDTTHERVLHFPMMFDWVGLEGIGLGKHGYDAVALTHTELVALPFNGLLDAARQDAQIERALYEAFSLAQSAHERDADLMTVIGAEQRVGRFLALQAHRHARRGLPAGAFELPMTRRDIGAFLGLSLETVSRALSSLAARGAICIDRRTVHIIDARHLAA